MARSRNIKPGFFTNDELAELPFEYRLLFIGLWTIADREGRLIDRPKKIRMEIFPADNVDCESGLQALATSGFIDRYEVDGQKIIQIINWAKHQTPHVRETESELPEKQKENAGTVQDTSKVVPEHILGSAEDMTEHGQDRLIPDSLNLIPDTGSLIPDPPLPDPRVPEGEVVDSAAPENSDDWLFRKIDEEQDSRIRFQLPLNWKPGEKFGAYCNGRCAKGKPITPADLTQRILLDFVQSNNAKGERLTRHQWEQRLATYLQSRLENQKEPPPNDPTQDPNFRYPEFVPPPRVENPCTKEQSQAYAESLIAKLKETAMDNF